jgi:hypothetical protein
MNVDVRAGWAARNDHQSEVAPADGGADETLRYQLNNSAAGVTLASTR